jgi:hypothetical protein
VDASSLSRSEFPPGPYSPGGGGKFENTLGARTDEIRVLGDTGSPARGIPPCWPDCGHAEKRPREPGKPRNISEKTRRSPGGPRRGGRKCHRVPCRNCHQRSVTPFFQGNARTSVALRQVTACRGCLCATTKLTKKRGQAWPKRNSKAEGQRRLDGSTIDCSRRSESPRRQARHDSQADPSPPLAVRATHRGARCSIQSAGA